MPDPKISSNSVVIGIRRTSIRAAIKVYPETGSLRLKIYELLVRAGSRGATDQEIESILGISGNSVRPLRGSLEKQGFIIDSGTTRENTNGNLCIVWKAVEEGMLL
jgi:transcription initiation factor IIE alpha subunit